MPLGYEVPLDQLMVHFLSMESAWDADRYHYSTKVGLVAIVGDPLNTP